MAIGGVVINFVAKTADAVRDVGKLDRSLNDVGGTAKKTAGKGGIGGLISSMGAAIPIAGALVVGAVGAAAALIDMSKAALEDSQQAKKLSQTLSNIPGITQAMIDKNAAWIDSMELATLVSDTELRAAISKLALATGDLGKAQTLAALAADVAAGSGKSYSTVADAMAKAAAGNTAQLERMFPWLDKNKDGSVDLAEAQKGLGKAFKGAADDAAKNDPWKRIQVIWGQISEALGGVLLPLIGQFGDWFADPKNRDNIQKIINKIADLAKEVGDKLVPKLEKFLDWMGSEQGKKDMRDFASSVKTIADAFIAIADAIADVIGWYNRLPNEIKHPDPRGAFWRAWDAATGRGKATTSSASPTASTFAATPTAATAPASVPPVIVTDEQIYRAVSRLLMRGDARNGRLVVVG